MANAIYTELLEQLMLNIMRASVFYSKNRAKGNKTCWVSTGALMVSHCRKGLKAMGYATLTTSLPGQGRVMTTCPYWHSVCAGSPTANKSTYP